MKILDRVDRETWWAVARACEYATFFHTPLWHDLAHAVVPGARDLSFEARLDDGTRAVVPLLARPRALFRLFGECQSTFAGCYGGPIADGPLAPDERRRLYEAADRTHGLALLTGNPLVPEGPGPRRFDAVEDSTHLLFLDEPLDALIERFSAGHRANLARGRRAGVVVRRASSLADYRRYHEVYEASLERWGGTATSRYPRALFERGWAHAAEHSDDSILWLAELDGSVVAGAWVFHWNQHAAYWHGASNEAGRRASATMVVFAHAIEHARSRGCRVFDFNPSGGHDGVAEFKRRFGAEPTRFPRYRRIHAPIRHLQRVAALATRWRR